MNTWKPFFIWNGKNSRSMGIETSKLPPIVRASERVQSVEVAGRHGVLHVTDGTFEPVNKSVEFGLRDLRNIDRIFKWLKGSGEVIFSNEPDRKYEAYIINKISLEKVVRQLRRGIVIFECNPFKYELNSWPIILTTPEEIHNPGNFESEPIITVYGKGAITMTINGRSFILREISDYIVIDSRIKNAYRGAGQLMNTHMEGEFPVLDAECNHISWTGNVTRVEIIPHWRWI